MKQTSKRPRLSGPEDVVAAATCVHGMVAAKTRKRSRIRTIPFLTLQL